MPTSELTDTEASVLQLLQREGEVDLYDLARAVGTGPRTVQEAVQRLAREDLVHVSDRQVRCTRAGERRARQL